MSNSMVKSSNDIAVSDELLLEKVILQNDLVGLSSIEKVQHIKNVCISLGLNPLTKPIQLHKFQGKEVMYMSKEGAEQIRKLNNASIIKMDNEILRNDIYVVKAYAQLPNGRQDCSTAALSIAGLKGDAIANAMMKCETKAKRRVTLSICGLGMLSEEELDTLPKDNAKNIKPIEKVSVKDRLIESKKIDFDVDEALLNISQCDSVEELKKLVSSYSVLKSNLDKESINKIVEAKNRKQESLKLKELENDDFIKEYDSVDQETGEIKENK